MQLVLNWYESTPVGEHFERATDKRKVFPEGTKNLWNLLERRIVDLLAG